MSSEMPDRNATIALKFNAAPGAEPKKIRERSFAFALRAIKLYRHLQSQKDGAGWVIGKQFLRAACSIGANVEEAQSGESRADFVHKLGITEKEGRESLYWLRLLAESAIVRGSKLQSLTKENETIIRILGSIILTTKQRGANQDVLRMRTVRRNS